MESLQVSKIALMSILMILGIGGVIYLINGLTTISKQDYLIVIPDKYEGLLIIIEDKERGNRIREKDEKITYRIPSNGILYVKEMKSHDFYYYDGQTYSGDRLCTRFDVGLSPYMKCEKILQDISKNNRANFWCLFYGTQSEFKKLEEEKKLGFGYLEDVLRIKSEYESEKQLNQETISLL